MPDDAPDPEYLDAFLQGASFALFALEGRLADEGGSPSPELAQALGDVHDLVASTREGLEVHRTSTDTMPPMQHYVGKN
jgi:hypothetical protein